jgi:hypothetical protein
MLRVQWHAKNVLPLDSKPSNTQYDLQIAAMALAAAPGLVNAHVAGASAVPLGNEEVDPAGDWANIYDWRSDARYPAAIARTLVMHIDSFLQASGSEGPSTVPPPVVYGYHANDNAFLNYGDQWFNQRTLTVRFMMNESVPAGQVEVIKKPGINLMSVLRLLGTQRLPASAIVASGDGTGDALSAPISALATFRSSAASEGARAAGSAARWEASLLVYNSNGALNQYLHMARAVRGTTGVILRKRTGTFACSTACEAVVNLTLCGLPTDVDQFDVAAAATPMLVHYVIDQQHGNPAALWRSMGGASNPYPTAAQFAALRRAAELVVLRRMPLNRTRGDVAVGWDPVVLTIEAPQPSVHLFHICSPPLSSGSVAEPPRVTAVQLRVTPTVSPPTVFIRWEQVDERCLQTYEVLWRGNQTSKPTDVVFERVNDLDLVSAAFVHAQPAMRTDSLGAHGCYSVRATNYWGVSGPSSTEVCLPAPSQA